jgi:hypothetical protein
MAEHKGQCKLTFGKELDYSQVWSFGAAKNLPHLSKINKGYTQLYLKKTSCLVSR